MKLHELSFKNNLVRVAALLFTIVTASAYAQTGKVGINTASPTEIFNVEGTARVSQLPANGTASSIYTKADGTSSAAKDQTFTATRTVVVDANGVLGTVSGLPTTQAAAVGENLSVATQAKCLKGAIVNGSYQFQDGQFSQIDFPNYSFRWNVVDGGAPVTGNEFLVRNNNNTTTTGIHKGFGGDVPGGTGSTRTTPYNAWVHFGNNINWDIEHSGEFIYYTSDYQGYHVKYWSQKFTGTTIPSFCWTITAYEGSTVSN